MAGKRPLDPRAASEGGERLAANPARRPGDEPRRRQPSHDGGDRISGPFHRVPLPFYGRPRPSIAFRCPSIAFHDLPLPPNDGGERPSIALPRPSIALSRPSTALPCPSRAFHRPFVAFYCPATPFHDLLIDLPSPFHRHSTAGPRRLHGRQPRRRPLPDRGRPRRFRLGWRRTPPDAERGRQSPRRCLRHTLLNALLSAVLMALRDAWHARCMLMASVRQDPISAPGACRWTEGRAVSLAHARPSVPSPSDGAGRSISLARQARRSSAW